MSKCNFNIPELAVNVTLTNEEELTGTRLQELTCHKPKAKITKHALAENIRCWSVDFGDVVIEGMLPRLSREVMSETIEELVRKTLDRLFNMYSDLDEDIYVNNDNFGIIRTPAFTSVDDLRDLEPEFIMLESLGQTFDRTEYHWRVEIRYDGLALIDCCEDGLDMEDVIERVKADLGNILDNVKDLLK